MSRTITKVNTQLCPEDCHYKSKLTRFCGYCMIRILKEREEKNNANGEKQTENAEQADRYRFRY